MADYEVKLRVDTDADEAKKDLEEIEAQGRRVKRSLGGGGGGGGKGPRATGREMGEELGNVAGKAIGKAVAGFIAHQVAGLAFEAMRTPGGDNTNVNRAQAAAGGALQYGTMGAMVGGPWGAAIGALVGGVTSLVGELQKEQQQIYATLQGIRLTNWEGANQTTSGIGKSALNALLERSWTGNGGRGEVLRGQVKSTLGHYRAAERRLEEASGWDHESEGYKVRQADFQRAQGQYFAAVGEWANERIARMSDAKPYGAGEFGDSFSARGIYMGPQVDVASVNDTLGDRMQEQVNLLRRLVDISNAGAGYQNERFAEMVRKLDSLTL